MRLKHLIVTALVAGSTVAQATETVTYSYDAQGRLITVGRSGGPSNGVVANYSFDRAGNRTATSTTGAWLDRSGRQVTVVPIAGLSVLPTPANP